jgi:hypothetical protein
MTEFHSHTIPMSFVVYILWNLITTDTYVGQPELSPYFSSLHFPIVTRPVTPPRVTAKYLSPYQLKYLVDILSIEIISELQLCYE